MCMWSIVFFVLLFGSCVLWLLLILRMVCCIFDIVVVVFVLMFFCLIFCFWCVLFFFVVCRIVCRSIVVVFRCIFCSVSLVCLVCRRGVFCGLDKHFLLLCMFWLLFGCMFGIFLRCSLPAPAVVGVCVAFWAFYVCL